MPQNIFRLFSAILPSTRCGSMIPFRHIRSENQKLALYPIRKAKDLLTIINEQIAGRYVQVFPALGLLTIIIDDPLNRRGQPTV